MKKYIIFIALLCVLNFEITAQDSSKVIYSPIPGLTAAPSPLCFSTIIEMGLYQSSSIFTDANEKKTLSEILGPAGDAHISILTYNISGRFSVSENTGFQINIPFISSQMMDFELNRGWRADRTDFYGENGIGDMSIGGWYFFSKNNKYRIQTTFDLVIPTGTPPDKLNEENFGSTGSGHCSYIFGLNWDLVSGSNMVTSLNASLVLNDEVKYKYPNISWIQDDGNEFHLTGQFTYKFTEIFSAGLRANYLSAAAVKIDGKEINDTQSAFIRLMPMLGFKTNRKKNSLSLILGYSSYIFGRNIFNLQGIHFGISKFYN